MPSHTVKQAKVMSAIAHGWHPDQGSVAKIPLKVAKEFHSADAGHKYGKGMHAVKHYRRKRMAEGGDPDLPDVGDPAISPGPQISRGTNIGNRAADIGSKVAYGQMAGAATLPYRYMKAAVDASKTAPGSEEAHEAYGDVGSTTGELGMSMLGSGRGSPTTSGAFVGPYGAMMLRNAERDAGKPPLVHPAVKAAMNGELPSELAGQLADKRDELAQRALADPKVSDRDIFPATAWSRDAAGNPVKEIPDTGVKLTPVGVGKYRLDHPAGDFHDIYDIPHFTIDKTKPAGEAVTGVYGNGKIAYIRLGAKDSNIRNKDVISAAMHEVQHAIAAKEGHPSGASPEALPARDDPQMARQLEQESFTDKLSPHTPSWWTPEQRKFSDAARKANMPEDKIQDRIARYRIYQNESGETQARNVQARLKGNLYKQHPEDTEDVSRGLQWQWNRFKPRPQEEVDKQLTGLKFAKGGRFAMGGFDPERAAAYGLSRQNNVKPQGMIKSSIPGRTDKLNMNVPSGSYIIPADIPSALGQGNSMAGSSILNRMFTRKSNIGTAKAPMGVGPRAQHPAVPHLSMHRASGGPPDPNAPPGTAPIVAAGGEYVIHPDAVADLGNGDIKLGHDILDAFVEHVRSKHIKTLQGLKPPKGSRKK